MSTHSSILAWKIPRTVEPGKLQSMGSQNMGHNERLSHTHTHTHYIYICVCVCVCVCVYGISQLQT